MPGKGYKGEKGIFHEWNEFKVDILLGCKSKRLKVKRLIFKGQADIRED